MKNSCESAEGLKHHFQRVHSSLWSESLPTRRFDGDARVRLQHNGSMLPVALNAYLYMFTALINRAISFTDSFIAVWYYHSAAPKGFHHQTTERDPCCVFGARSQMCVFYCKIKWNLQKRRKQHWRVETVRRRRLFCHSCLYVHTYRPFFLPKKDCVWNTKTTVRCVQWY